MSKLSRIVVRITLLTLFLIFAGLYASAVTFTSNTTIADGDATYDGQAIVVSGCTVTIDGAHPFASLSITNNGIVTHTANTAGCVLTIAGDVNIDSGCMLDVSGRGFPGGNGPGAGSATANSGWGGGGGGHGGTGGTGRYGMTGGAAYDSIPAPAQFGSGGGSGSGNAGGAGGGRIRLAVTGNVTVAGSLLANGNAGNPTYGGGGAGGSIHLTAATLSGAGTISAVGGNGGTNGGGGGAGGRIALVVATNAFTGTLAAPGGAAGAVAGHGGAGTIFTRTGGAGHGAVRVDNASQAGGRTPLTPAFWSGEPTFALTIANAAVGVADAAFTVTGLTMTTSSLLTHTAGGTTSIDLTVSGNASIDGTSAITAAGCGFAPGGGPAAGGSTANSGWGGGGGGHGGVGGMGRSGGGQGGGAYDQVLQPAQWGSGGGSGSGISGGAGGGLIHLAVTGTLTVNGTISTNGSAGTPSYGGGGAGGSLYLSAGTLTGAGAISALGGDGGVNGGGGGAGGRIAVVYTTNTFAGTLAAQGGTAGTAAGHGGAGTIYTKAGAAPRGTVLIDNAGLASALTTLDPAFWTGANPFDLVIRNHAVGVADVPITLYSLRLDDHGVLTHTAHVNGLNVTVNGNAIIGPLGAVNVSGRGYPQQTGPGAGGSTGNSGWGGGGGGHGGSGGIGRSGGGGSGPAYDSLPAPADFGSGGGTGSGEAGGAGGGLARLIVTGTFTVDGLLAANGGSGGGNYGGGGSGGSVYVTAGTLDGVGTISALGGDGSGGGGGGGAGGRIALVYASKSFTGTLAAQGGAAGTSAGHGGAGTIYTKVTGAAQGAVRIDNTGRASAVTPLNPDFWPAETPFDLTVINHAVGLADWAITLHSLLVDAGAIVTHSAGGGPSLAITVTDNTAVTSSGSISVAGRGFATQAGPGAGGTTGNGGWGGGGGGHGGIGGRGRNGDDDRGGLAYGSVPAPAHFGSGGGHGSGQAGGAGGGYARLIVNGTFTLDGLLTANGENSPGSLGGGGGGGGVYVTVGTLAGGGTIAVQGGGGGVNGGGGGAGGRIALVYDTMTFTGTLAAQGGSAGTDAGHGGAGTIYTKATAAPRAVVQVDNAGLASTRTPLNPEFWTGEPDFDLTLSDNAIGLADWPITLANLRIETDAILTHTGGGSPAINITVTQHATVTSDSSINVSGRGHATQAGPGAGGSTGNGGWGGGGAGHGGIGGVGRYGGGGSGIAYDSLPAPASFGSGGGYGSGQAGGAGGGLARLVVNGTFTLDGLLAADGAHSPSSYGGGGSGGSIYVTAGTLAGGGTISALGGGGGVNGGGGGAGGRIALVYDTMSFAGTLAAQGGSAGTDAGHGGAGTIFTKASGAAHGAVRVDNGTLSHALTPLNPGFWTDEPAFDLTVANHAVGLADWEITLASLLVENNAWITHSTGSDQRVKITVSGNALIADDSTVDVTGRGYPQQAGPGAGATTGNGGWGGGGGGHGGAGGAGRYGMPGGGTNDEVTAPTMAGSGGGGGSGYAGGSGGGVERLIVQGTLTVNGMLLANGNADTPTYGGGGAGGSIYLTVNTLDGHGHIRAMGGNGGNNGGGGGGGGRIAICCQRYRYTGQYDVSGGAGGTAAGDGGVGTIYFCGERQPDLQVRAQGDADFLGDDIYRTLPPQTKTVTLLPGQTATFDVRLQSDSAAPDRFVVTGPVSAGGWTIDYLDAGGAPLPLNPTTGWTTSPDSLTDDTFPITVRVTAGAVLTSGSAVDVLLHAKSFYHPDEYDEVIARVVINSPPTAVNDTYGVNEDTVLTVPAPGVLGNDTDVDGNPLTAVKNSDPAHGSLTLHADGSFTYTPSANWHGTDSFTYRAHDGYVTSNVGTVTITVLPANDAPVAANNDYTTPEDTPLNVTTPGVLDNDSDIDGNSLTAVKISDPTHGTVALNANGSFTYTPEAEWHGTDSFTYRANDGITSSNIATVTLTVTAVNDSPVVMNDSYETDEDVLLTVPAPGVLGNDTDIDGDTLSAVIVSDPANGTVTLNADGSFVYTPTANWHGVDSFTYRVVETNPLPGIGKATAGVAALDAGIVTITVHPVNDAPVATDDLYATPQGQTLDVPAPGLLGNDADRDGDGLTAVQASGPSHGQLMFHGDGSFSYLPEAGYAGPASFTYRAFDGTADSNLATVTLNILAGDNHAPAAANDGYQTDEDVALQITAPSVLGNDTDDDGDPLTAVKVSDPAHGVLVLHTDGSFIYTPDANWHGTDAFTYQASDGNASSNIATVSLTVLPVNDAPVAADNTYSTNEDIALAVPAPGVLGNDADIDGDLLSAVQISGPAHGALVLNTDGSFSYTPDANWHGADAFTYRAGDGTDDSSTATVTITVQAVNDAPVAAVDAYATDEDTPLTMPAPGLLVNDSDIDSGTVTAVKASNPAHGSVVLAANGAFTYTPAAHWHGTDSFAYYATDGVANSGIATVTITVKSVNDAPTALNDAYTTSQNTLLTVPAPGVLANDVDVDGDTLEVLVTSLPVHGTLVINGDGSFTYQPDSGYVGQDQFTYQAYDGNAASPEAVVTINVVAEGNTPPVAHGQAVKTYQGYALYVYLQGTDADGDPVKYRIVTAPQHGIVTNPGNANRVVYLPSSGYIGPDSFTFVVNDGTVDSAPATVMVTVAPRQRLQVQYSGAITYFDGTVWRPFAKTGMMLRPGRYWLKFDGTMTSFVLPEGEDVVVSVAKLRCVTPTGLPIARARTAYFAANGWHGLTPTDAQGATLAVLPGLQTDIAFALLSPGTRKEMTQNIAVNSVVTFTTP